MSQAEFGNPPEVVPTPHQTEQTNHEQSEELQQQLRNCNLQCEQANLLLNQAQGKLELSEQLIQERNEQSKHFQEHISQLEKELADKCEQLEQSNAKCEFLRTHLNREQKQVSQLKSLLERFWDGEENYDSKTSSTTSSSSTTYGTYVEDLEALASASQNITDTWVSSLPNNIELDGEDEPEANAASTAKASEASLSDTIEISVSPIEQFTAKLNLPLELQTDAEIAEPLLPSLEAPAIEVRAHQAFNHPVPNQNQISDYANHLILPQVNTPQFMQVLSNVTKHRGPAPLIDRSRHRATNSLAAVKLPKFPPLQPL
jgi:hypothetical protein